jgi:hypothetical protein
MSGHRPSMCCALALSLSVALSLASRAAAQQPGGANRPGPRTIVGVVADTLGRPLDSVEVLLSSRRRRVVTTSDGAFRFDDVSPGSYDLSARRLGFLPQVQSVRVTEQGGEVHFALVPFLAGLPPLVSSSARGGLSGVVGDTAYRILSGAEVKILASDRATVSDSTGAFFLDVKPGRYMVRITRPGYEPRLVSVNLPSDSGRRIVVWLTPASQGAAVREAFELDSLSRRLLLRNPVWSKIYTREDIVRSGMDEATQLATAGANKRIDQSCMAHIDGHFEQQAPIWSISAADIEMMEVYTSPPRSYAATSIKPRRSTRAPPVDNNCPAQIWIWLRK